MDPVQALAILSFGAFVTVAITAVTYMLAVRPRLLEPETPLEAQPFSETVHQELAEQRLIIDRMNTTLTRHTAELSANASGSVAGPGLDSMRSVLDTQFAAVRKIGSMLLEQAERLSAVDERITEQGERLVALEASVTASTAQPDPAQEHLLALIQSEADQLAEISGRLLAWNQMSQEQAAKQSETLHQIEVMNGQLTAQAEMIRQLEERVAVRLESLAQLAAGDDAQAGKLAEISGRLLSAWNQMHQEQVARQSDVLRMVENVNNQIAAQADVIRQLEERVASKLESIMQPTGDEAQSAKLAEISGQLQAWHEMSQQQVARQSDVLRMVENVNDQIAAQADVIRQLEERVTSKLESIMQPVGDEAQASLLEKLQGQIGEILANLPRSDHPLGPGQDRLTDIEGIGPVYSGKLYKAGITTFEQLAAKTPKELTDLIGVPEWRARSIDTQSWIDQAKHLAALREKVETDQ